MAEEVLLFGVWASPFSSRVELALKLKGVQYKYLEEDLNNKSPSLLQYNPIHKKVPVLVHNGKPIVESQVILEYIDETWQGYPLLPKDPYERAIARFWVKFIDDKCWPALRKAFIGEEKGCEKAVEEASEVLKFLEKELKEKRFFGGESIGTVDIAANIIGGWLGACEEATGVEFFTREKFPKLSNWIDEFVSNSIIKENLPPRDKLVPFLRYRFESVNASK
ncbi:glutathione S-transferase U8-like [Alnus glutinosa]|uniref:glutathione S-transferase U8-like n=1 Tax=Alnus glutinosa TaxID=3517 RepID=UPI002D7738AA|nr:glutathione S-transferase U8-like [Alnus glutinosa]